MARLTSAERKALPTSAFAIPEKRGYPIHDASHARDALSEVSQHGSADEKSRVRAAVKKRYPTMGKSDGDNRGDDKKTPPKNWRQDLDDELDRKVKHITGKGKAPVPQSQEQ